MSAAQRWRAALHAAARLGLGPDAFWRLGVAEWRALAGDPNGDAAVMTRGEFECLMRRYPDTEETRDG